MIKLRSSIARTIIDVYLGIEVFVIFYFALISTSRINLHSGEF